MDSGENRVIHGGWVFEPISAPVLAASVASPPHPIAAACRASVPTFRVTFPSFKVSTLIFVDLTFPHFDNFCGLASSSNDGGRGVPCGGWKRWEATPRGRCR